MVHQVNWVVILCLMITGFGTHLINPPKKPILYIGVDFLVYHFFDNSSFKCVLVLAFLACIL